MLVHFESTSISFSSVVSSSSSLSGKKEELLLLGKYPGPLVLSSTVCQCHGV